MRILERIGEFFLFRWMFGRARKTGRQEMPEMSVPYRDNNGLDFELYCDMDEADCLGHKDYDCCEDVLDEREDYDMTDDDF